MPFDAMKGLQEALRDREERHTRVERHEISEEQMERNSAVLARLERGDRVELECYLGFHDVRRSGTVTEISTVMRTLTLGEEKIYFEDIYTIRMI